jgi:hypothetical protein
MLGRILWTMIVVLVVLWLVGLLAHIAGGALPSDMVDNSIRLCNPPSGRYFVMRESREPFFSRSKAASEYFCEHLHQISRDLTLL